MDPIIVQAPQRLYCGNKNPVPPGYAGYDTRFSCLRKGVGIGLYKLRRDAQAGGNGGNGAPPPRVMLQPRLFPVTTWWSQVPWWGWAILLGLVILVILVLLLFLLK